jgi:UDP-2,3-diacylglucosamine hydrolase
MQSGMDAAEPAPMAASSLPAATTTPPALRVADAAAAWFASDMHLDDAQPQPAARFFEHLDAALAAALANGAGAGAAALAPGPAAPALFLLGDIFEYWVGDDHQPAVAQALSGRLAAFTGAGGRVFLMHGNRDFLLDVPLPARPDLAGFSARCGAVLLPDPTLIEVAGRRIVLSHGDALCSDDVRYQQWRALCRSPAWQQQFLARPVAERLEMARAMRQQSLQAQAATETIGDVDQVSVDALLTRFGATLLVHGHTHRPLLHQWGERRRWVLSDWAAEAPRGEVLPLAVLDVPVAPDASDATR